MISSKSDKEGPLPALPFYARAALFLIGLYVFINMLSIAQDIILPVIYAVIIAVSISPAVDFLVKKKINRAISITAVLSTTFLITAVLLALIISRASRLSEAWPQLAGSFEELITRATTWVSGYFEVSPHKINMWIADTKSELLNHSSNAIGNTLSTLGGVLSTVLLTPVYVFMILLYQSHLLEFIYKLFGTGNDGRAAEMLTKTKTIIQSYLIGLFAEFAIIGALNCIGLLILGIDYAILLGVVGAFLNIIPYLGGIIAVALFMMVALVTKPLIYLLYVVVLYSIIQFIDNNYIVPKIVGSKVKLNALFSLVAVIAGAALWGIPGMFLSIPIIAILKLILDRTESLKPWGFLLGDTTTPLLELEPILKKLKKKLPVKSGQDTSPL